MSERSPRFCSWWTPGLGVIVWHHCVRVHDNISSSRVWMHGTVIHHSWLSLSLGPRLMKTHSSIKEMKSN